MRRTTRAAASNLNIPGRAGGLRNSRNSHKAALPLSGRKQPRTQRGLPPVLARGGGSMVQMPGRGKSSRTRRRYDVALSIPGAEVRLPALPALQFSWRMISGLLALLLAAGLYYVWTAPLFQVEALTITGLQRLVNEDLERALDISGESIFVLNPAELRSQLVRDFPELSSVSVAVALPAEVAVVVEERVPVLAWFQNGQEVWVDAQGYAFTPRGDMGELPAVEGNPPPGLAPEDGESAPRFVEPGLVGAVIKMAERVPENTRIAFHEQHGLGWWDERGWQAYFGMDLEKMDAKLQVYSAVVANLEQQGIQPALISLEFLHAPYYRLER
jgi:cell division protein FtsQ